MGAGGSSERRASVGVVGVGSSGRGAPVFQQRQLPDARGCSIDTRNSRDFTDISNSEAGGIISPQFIVSYNKKSNNGFSFRNGGSGKQIARAPPTSSCSSLGSHNAPGLRTSSVSSCDSDSNKENTTPDRLSGNAPASLASKSKMQPGTSTSQNGITRVQPRISTPPHQVSDDDNISVHTSGNSRSQPGLESSNQLSSNNGRPLIGSASSSFESRTISEGIHRRPQRVVGETSISGETNKDEGTSRSRSPTCSPNSGDLKIEEVA
ncbi:hypothetical protein FHG87_022038 [Trinorchestia longiramus]|nr:hypothetical protein FHG87_022038 [Trinorchestia longiramus]